MYRRTVATNHAFVFTSSRPSGVRTAYCWCARVIVAACKMLTICGVGRAPQFAPVAVKIPIEIAREQVAVCVNNQLPIYEVEKVKDTWPDNQPLPNTLAITNGKMSDPLTRNVVLAWANEATGANSGARPTPHMVSILHAATMTLAH